jgi:riboflavin synthase alpha subunit
MFTGIIQRTGAIAAAQKTADGVSLTIRAAGFVGSLSPGDSVAVNGVCLTAEQCGADSFTATAVGETLERTTLGKTRAGANVNLEGAATLDTALGGHLVQGHVDGVGRVKSFVKKDADRLLTIELPEDVYSYVVPKGSIAIDGISLTVVERLPGRRITITIVPFTVEHTIAASYRAGVEVNVEADIIGKYIKEYLGRMKAGGAGA